MENVSQRCKVKVEKCHFIILWCFRVIEEKPQGGGGGGGERIRPPGIDRVKYLAVHWLTHNSKPKSRHVSNLQSNGDFNGGSSD